ncbi:MAG: MBL fold metallo-hydrolase [Acholeplasmatales bacterium]|nr:MBL fold metallo-hydrolase [Acholeplasmatales bacterium]
MYIIKEKNNKWILIKKGSKRATKTFSSKAEAIAYAEMKGYKYDIAGTKVDNVIRKAKKKPKVVIPLLIVLFLIIIGVFLYLHFTGNLTTIINSITKKEDKTEEHNHNSTIGEDGIVNELIYDDFQIHFLELGNHYTGDSTYIKAGDIDILIDAGSRTNSAETIKKYVDNYCTDGKLEYVIATHCHQDHVAGFYGNKSGSTRTGILYQYQIGTIIDFALSDINNTVSQGYYDARDYAVSKGAKHYTAAECFNNENGAKNKYQLTDTISFDVLYNYYYFNSAKSTEGEENNYSVCTMFNYNDNHYILTGDLEGEGESKLIDYYDGTNAPKLPHCALYKGGHHGSKTSSTDKLLNAITPSMCCVCCCAGDNEYTYNLEHQFPTQSFINRIAKHTDRVYVTTYYDEKSSEFKSLNGNIVVSSNGEKIAVKGSNNTIKLKDSDWFNEKIYAVPTKNYYDGFRIYQNCTKAKGEYYNESTPDAELRPRRTLPDEWK